MRRRLSYVNRKYFQQLLAGLMVFILLLYLPFSFLVLHIAKKNILHNTEVSNQTVLQQLKSNYQFFSENLSTLAASLFWRSDVQQLLYTKSPDLADVYRTLSDLNTSILPSHPNLHSICLYNKYTKELYTITSTGHLDKTQFMDFVESRESLPVLRPILHNVVSNANTLQDTVLETSVFSYFLYQFGSPSQGFLVLNQNALPSINSLNTFTDRDDGVTSTISYVTATESISSQQAPSEQQAAYQMLLDNFRSTYRELNSQGGFYEDTADGTRYLVTYTIAEPLESALLIFQEYDQVFSDLHALQRDFILIFSVLLVVALAMAMVFSQRLYRPIDAVFNYFSRSNQEGSHFVDGRGGINELDYIKTIYDTTSEQNKRLETRENRYRPIAQEYSLRSFLLKSNEHGMEQFRRVQPTHWLAQCPEDTPFQVLLCRSNSWNGNMDMSMLLYAVQNIVEELLDPSFSYASFKYGSNTLGVVLSPKNDTAQNQLPSILDQLRSVMQEHFAAQFTVGRSETRAGIASLTDLLQQADLCLSYTFLLDTPVLTPDLCLPHERNSQTSYDPALDTRLEDAIAKQDLAQCRQVLSEIQSVLRTFSTSNATICTAGLFSQVNRILRKQSNVSANSASSASFRTLYARLSGGGSMNQCFDDILRYIASNLSNETQEDKNSDQLFVETVFEFVQNSYFDVSLSSQLIADYLGLSNRYLMKKFKTLTDITLAEYIADFRMKKAASLLQNTQDSISSIAEQVGIDNLSYFYRLFKKAYGCTPKEFRDMNQLPES